MKTALYDRLSIYQTILDSGLMPLFYHHDPAIAHQVVQACAEGGARVIEFVNRGEQALSVFSALQENRRQSGSPVILGVGTVLDAPTAALFLAHGADFIVGPNFNPEIARLCNRRKIPYIPGCSSATEISAAEEIGAEIIKIFPANELGGPDFIKNLLAPMPWSKLMPSGGVDLNAESVSGWIRAGAACVAMGSRLIRRDLLAKGDFESLVRNVGQVIGWIKVAREKKPFPFNLN